MAGKSVRAGRRIHGSLLGAGALAVLVVASTAACGSTSATASGASGSPVTVTTSGSGAASPSPAPSSGAPTTPTTGAASGGPTGGPSGMLPGGGPVITPQAQLTAEPAGRRLTPFESAERSSNGTTLYLGLVSQGGACGRYDVVLEQSSSSVQVGLVLLPSGGKVCPMFMGHMLVEATLSAPLGDRSVVDLATGQPVAVSLR